MANLGAIFQKRGMIWGAAGIAAGLFLGGCGAEQQSGGTTEPKMVSGQVTLTATNTQSSWANHSYLHYTQTPPEQLGHGAGLSDGEWQMGGEDAGGVPWGDDAYVTFVRATLAELSGVTVTALTLTIHTYADPNPTRKTTGLELRPITNQNWTLTTFPGGKQGIYWDKQPETSASVANLDPPVLGQTYEIDLMPVYVSGQPLNFALWPKRTFRNFVHAFSPLATDRRPVITYTGTK